MRKKPNLYNHETGQWTDAGLTEVQAFIRKEARRLRHLFCTICGIEPPKFTGGPCDDCDNELGSQ